MRHALTSRRLPALASCLALVLSGLAGPTAQAAPPPEPAAAPAEPLAASDVGVLVFHGPVDEQNDAVTEAVAAITKLGSANGFSVDEAEDPGVFTPVNLSRYRGVVFLSALGVNLSAGQEAALKAFVQAGGGFLGVHDAARAQSGSSWFTGLIR